MYCMHCGEQIPNKSRYCKYCGRLVAEDEIISYSEENADDSGEGVGVKEEFYSKEVNDDEADFHISLRDEKEQEEIVDDIFLEHLSGKKKIGLFFIAVCMTAIVAVIVFAIFFPELI